MNKIQISIEKAHNLVWAGDRKKILKNYITNSSRKEFKMHQ